MQNAPHSHNNLYVCGIANMVIMQLMGIFATSSPSIHLSIYQVNNRTSQSLWMCDYDEVMTKHFCEVIIIEQRSPAPHHQFSLSLAPPLDWRPVNINACLVAYLKAEIIHQRVKQSICFRSIFCLHFICRVFVFQKCVTTQKENREEDANQKITFLNCTKLLPSSTSSWPSYIVYKLFGVCYNASLISFEHAYLKFRFSSSRHFNVMKILCYLENEINLLLFGWGIAQYSKTIYNNIFIWDLMEEALTKLSSSLGSIKTIISRVLS